jgi:glycosyltransferase involved in cell wall biosynthesis
MKRAFVTIGIPCYNCDPYLSTLIRSIQAQTYTNWNVIAIDDGSTDNTRDVLRSIKDPRFHIVLESENRGLAYRLNQIADLASGTLLARTDADDIMLPHRIETQVRAFQENPSLDVCSSSLYVVNNANQLRGLRRLPKPTRDPVSVMLRNGPSHPTVMSTVQWARQNRYRCEHRRGEDLDLWIRTISTSKVLLFPEPLHIIREDEQFDHEKYQRTIRDHRRVVRHHLTALNDPLTTLRVEATMLARKWVYRIATTIGYANRLAARRNLPVCTEEYERVMQFVKSVAACEGNCAPDLDRQLTSAMTPA